MANRIVGLTDQPEEMRRACGNPQHWQQCVFQVEEDARAWLDRMLEKSGNSGEKGGKGWKHGYTYLKAEKAKPDVKQK